MVKAIRVRGVDGQVFIVKETNPYFEWYKKMAERRGIFKILEEFKID